MTAQLSGCLAHAAAAADWQMGRQQLLLLHNADKYIALERYKGQDALTLPAAEHRVLLPHLDADYGIGMQRIPGVIKSVVQKRSIHKQQPLKDLNSNRLPYHAALPVHCLFLAGLFTFPHRVFS